MTKQDCIKFEIAMLNHYKDFEKIQKNYFPHKNTQQLIEYFYFWKKSANYDLIRSNKSQSKNELSISQEFFL